MRKLVLLPMILCLASIAGAQNPIKNPTASLTTSGTSTSYTITSAAWQPIDSSTGAAVFSLSGTWSGTVTFYGSVYGGTIQTISVTPSNSATTVTTSTGNGIWQFNTAGYSQVYMILTTATSGTAVANISTSTASARSNGGGGGGGSGSVSNQAAKAISANTSGTSTAVDSIVCIPPTTNGVYAVGYTVTGGVAPVPTCPLVGLTQDQAAGTNVLYSDNNNMIYAPAAALALPTPTSLGNSNFFTVLVTNGTASTVTPATWTISLNGAAGGLSAVCPAYSRCSITVDQVTSTQWDMNTNDAGGYIAGTQFTGTAGHVVDFGSGGKIPADSGVVAANVVTASSPSAGLCHFAGSTQACTSSAVSLTADVSGILPVANGGTNLASGTSGGILGYTASGTLASSGALTSNVLVKGGGAGATPTNSLTTDDGTSSTYTGTGGTKSPAFTATGTTAGFADYPQGTTSAAVAPCNTATSICEQAPTSVTSYLITKPGAAPNIASYKQTDGCGSASCTETYHPVPQVLTVTTDFTTANNTNLQTITGLSLTMPVSKAVVASFHCNYSWSQATGTAAVAFGIQGATTAPTNLEATATSFSNTTAETTGTLTALASTTATNVVSVAPSAITTIWKAELDGTLEAPSNASPTVLNFMTSTATGADAVTVKRGSYCMVMYQ